MATTFLSRFQREKSERQVSNENNNNNKEKTKIGGFSLSLSRSSAVLATPTEDLTQPVPETKAPARQQRRYIRSATAASVTQLLSDGCNNLLQRFRRNPSERPDKRQLQQHKETR